MHSPLSLASICSSEKWRDSSLAGRGVVSFLCASRRGSPLLAADPWGPCLPALSPCGHQGQPAP